MNRALLFFALSTLSICLLMTDPAESHDYLTELRAPAGHLHDIEIRVAHGCKGSRVNEVRVKIPEDIYTVRMFNNRNWQTEVKMRKVDPPVVGDFGRPITETVDEIIWKNPKSPIPDMTIEGFRFRAMLPNEPGRVLFFRTLNQCEEGDDNYIDLPETEININDEDFAEKFMSFITATATPSPYLILYKSELPQYPWEWDTQEIRDAAIAGAN